MWNTIIYFPSVSWTLDCSEGVYAEVHDLAAFIFTRYVCLQFLWTSDRWEGGYSYPAGGSCVNFRWVKHGTHACYCPFNINWNVPYARLLCPPAFLARLVFLFFRSFGCVFVRGRLWEWTRNTTASTAKKTLSPLPMWVLFVATPGTRCKVLSRSMFYSRHACVNNPNLFSWRSRGPYYLKCSSSCDLAILNQ